jgi:hypothetical protein
MDKTQFLDAVESELNGLESLKDEYPIEHFKDDTEGMTVANIARLQKQLSGLLERAGQIKTHLQKCYDFVRYSRIPEIMDIEDLESVRIEGVGRLYLTSDYNVSTRAGRKQEAMEWLIENGFGDIVQETVNASTLKAIIKKEVIAKGKEVPEDLFNVAPFTRSQITK